MAKSGIISNKPSIEKIKSCCCISYERGVTPCMCQCHQMDSFSSCTKPSIEEWEKYRVFIIPADMPCDGAEILLYYGSKVAPNINRIVAQEFNMKEYISTLTQSRQEVIEEVLACAPKKKEYEGISHIADAVKMEYNQAIDDFIQSIKKIK